MKTVNGKWLLLPAALLLSTVTHAGPEPTPRAFCRAGGGTVQETGHPDIYICCYPARQRCLAVNDRSRQSVRVVFPDGKESESQQRLR